MLLAALWGFVSAKLGWPALAADVVGAAIGAGVLLLAVAGIVAPGHAARARPDGPLRLRVPLLPRPRHRRRALVGDVGLPAGPGRRHVDRGPAGGGQPLRPPPRAGRRGHDRRRHLHRAVGLGAGPVRLPRRLRRGRPGAADAPEPARPAGRLGAARHRRPGRRGDALHAQWRDLHRADPRRRPGPHGDRQLGAAGGRAQPAGRAGPAGEPGRAAQHPRRRRRRQRPGAERPVRLLVDDHRPVGVLVPAIVFTASTDTQQGYYWRGATYDTFDGTTWKQVDRTNDGEVAAGAPVLAGDRRRRRVPRSRGRP